MTSVRDIYETLVTEFNWRGQVPIIVDEDGFKCDEIGYRFFDEIKSIKSRLCKVAGVLAKAYWSYRVNKEPVVLVFKLMDDEITQILLITDSYDDTYPINNSSQWNFAIQVYYEEIAAQDLDKMLFIPLISNDHEDAVQLEGYDQDEIEELEGELEEVLGELGISSNVISLVNNPTEDY